MRYAWLLLALAACNMDKSDKISHNTGNWATRSEEVCGPGYLLITEPPSSGGGKYCVPYKLPNEAMR